MSTAAGRIKATAAAPMTTGAGVGYLLRDRHSSVTAVVDSTGAVTNTYAYGDYGAPALLDGRPGSLVGAAAGASPGRANPLQYSGGGLKTLYTDSGLGTLMTPARFYDPSQGRFTSRDTANVHNRYGAFDANPVMKLDPSGRSPISDTTIDALYVVVFAISMVLSAGALSAAWAAFGAAELTVAVVVPVIAQAAAVASNLAGFASYGTRLVDDTTALTGSGHFLTDDTRDLLNNVGTVAGSVAGAAGGVSSFVTAGAAAEAADASAAVARAGANAPPADPIVGGAAGDEGAGGPPPPRPTQPLPYSNGQDVEPVEPQPRNVPAPGGPQNALPDAPPLNEVNDPVLADAEPKRPPATRHSISGDVRAQRAAGFATLAQAALAIRPAADENLNGALADAEQVRAARVPPWEQVPRAVEDAPGLASRQRSSSFGGSPSAPLDPNSLLTRDRNNLAGQPPN